MPLAITENIPKDYFISLSHIEMHTYKRLATKRPHLKRPHCGEMILSMHLHMGQSNEIIFGGIISHC